MIQIEEYVGKSVINLIDGRRGVCVGAGFWLYGCEYLKVVFQPLKKEIFISSYSDEGVIIHPRAVMIEKGALDASDYVVDRSLIGEYLGKEVKEKITDFTGICTGIYFPIYSSPITFVTGKCVDGKDIPSKAFDIGRLEVTGAGFGQEEVQGENKEYHGGDVEEYEFIH